MTVRLEKKQQRRKRYRRNKEKKEKKGTVSPRREKGAGNGWSTTSQPGGVENPITNKE